MYLRRSDGIVIADEQSEVGGVNGAVVVEVRSGFVAADEDSKVRLVYAVVVVGVSGEPHDADAGYIGGADIHREVFSQPFHAFNRNRVSLRRNAVAAKPPAIRRAQAEGSGTSVACAVKLWKTLF